MRSVTAFQNFGEVVGKQWFSVSATLIRVALGVQLFWSATGKFGDWTAEKFLTGATGPLALFFQSMAGNPVVDALNIWGQLLIGVALILGLMVRPASFFGIILMILYYLAGFDKNTANGLIDFHIIYSLLLLMFLAGGIGHMYGLDGIVYRQFRKRPMLAKVFFG